MTTARSRVTHRRIPTLAVFLVLASVLGPLADSAEAGYRLPWRHCFWESVTQGWNGSYSHTGTMKYAYDFGHWEGAQVRAAQSGTVDHVKSDIDADSCCSSSSCANDANYVVIDHGDGKSTLYLHLKTVSVSSGNTVLRGQEVGTAGKTGWTSCDPHLHYQRQKQGGWFTQSVKGYFDEYPGTELSSGSSYRSQNYWPGDYCPMAMASPVSTEIPHRVVALDAGIVRLLSKSPRARFEGAAEHGLSFEVPGGVEPRWYRADAGDDWPDYLPTWNLHFRIDVSPGDLVPLDAQVEGYPGQHDVLALLDSKEQAGSMERVQVLDTRPSARGEVVVWRWENVAGAFLSAARVEPGGIVMAHANTAGVDDVRTLDGRQLLLHDFLLPRLDGVTWHLPMR